MCVTWIIETEFVWQSASRAVPRRSSTGLRQLPVAIEHRPATWLCQQILPLTRAYRLSAYDAAYLELARREGLPLATLDGDLQSAARAHGVALLEMPV